MNGGPEGADTTNPGAAPGGYDHRVLKSLLGAWALSACSAEETAALEAHLMDCPGCTEEAGRLRKAVGLLHPEESLDLDPALRSRVLEGCLQRRPARVPVPSWAAPYEAETARLDALLRDMAGEEWSAPVQLRWFDGSAPTARDTTVAGVISHLTAVDGITAEALGLPGPLTADLGPEAATDPEARTEAYWASPTVPAQRTRIRASWREQSHAMIRAASFARNGVSGTTVTCGPDAVPLPDAFLERAFECWVHAGDIADAIDYPYDLPTGEHLHQIVDLAARSLPEAVARRRRAGLAASPPRLTASDAPGRTLHLEIEGRGGGHWYVSLDSPGVRPSKDDEVAHVALDSAEFCQLAAGHVPPQEAAAGQDGDRDAIRDVLYAAASLSRL